MVVALLVYRSVHNQQIERLWRDVFSACVFLFYRIFYALEDADLLDPSNDADLFALLFVYLPRINQQLDTFRVKVIYSNHRLRSEGNMTPYQLWIEGIARLNTDPFAVDGAQECTIWEVNAFMFNITVIIFLITSE